MKTIFTLPKTLRLLMLIFLLNTGISCKDQKNQKDLNEQIDQLEDDESFAGSSKRDDICELLKIDDIRSVFELSDAAEIDQDETKGAICSYEWEASGEKYMYYTVSLNFARGGNRTSSQIDAIWEDQNKKLYERHELQEVSNVGDKASWSKLGGGQLRVAANGYIFYVSHSVMVMPGEDKPKDTQGMIDKTKDVAKRVIKRM